MQVFVAISNCFLNLLQLRMIPRALKDVGIPIQIGRPQHIDPSHRSIPVSILGTIKIETRSPTTGMHIPRMHIPKKQMRQIILAVFSIHMQSKRNLPQVIRAVRPLRNRFCLAQRRQQKRRQNADDGNNPPTARSK